MECTRLAYYADTTIFQDDEKSVLLSVSEKIPRAANITLEFVLRDSQNRDRRGRQASILGTSRHRGKQHASGNDGAVTFGRKKVEVVVPLLEILLLTT